MDEMRTGNYTGLWTQILGLVLMSKTLVKAGSEDSRNDVIESYPRRKLSIIF